MPAWGRPADDWARVAPGLTDQGSVLAVELPPPGRRHEPAAGVLVAEQQHVLELLPEADHVVLVGHSLGSVVALLLAARLPTRCRGVVLTASFMPIARNGRTRRATLVDYGQHRLLFARDALRHRRSSDRQRPGGRAALRSLAYLGLRPAVFHAQADRVGCPVLLLHGERDHHVPAAFVQAAVTRHPDWRLALLPGAGHFPHRDRPELWLGGIRPWLATLEH